MCTTSERWKPSEDVDGSRTNPDQITMALARSRTAASEVAVAVAAATARINLSLFLSPPKVSVSAKRESWVNERLLTVMTTVPL